VPSAGLIEIARNPIVSQILRTVLQQALVAVQAPHGLPSTLGASDPFVAAGLPGVSTDDPSAFLPALLPKLLPILRTVIEPAATTIITKLIESRLSHGMPMSSGPATTSAADIEHMLRMVGGPAVANPQASDDPSAFLPAIFPLLGALAPVAQTIITKIIESQLAHRMPAASSATTSTAIPASDDPAAFLPALVPFITFLAPIASTLVEKIIESRVSHGLPASAALQEASVAGVESALKSISSPGGVASQGMTASDEPSGFLPALPFLLPLIGTAIAPLATALVNKVFESRAAHSLPTVANGITEPQNALKVNLAPQVVATAA
jgi:hypothetical protein